MTRTTSRGVASPYAGRLTDMTADVLDLRLDDRAALLLVGLRGDW